MKEFIAGDITRITFSVLLIGVLLTGTFWVMQPFLPAMIWAAMIVITAWPLMLRVQARFRNSRRIAVILMTTALLLVFVLPLSLAILTFVQNLDEITEGSKSLLTHGIPQPPHWLGNVPVLGPRLVARWQQAASVGKDEMINRIAPYIGNFLGWLLRQIGGLGKLFLHFLLTLILSAVMFSHGETAAQGVVRFARRLGGDRGESAAKLAALSVRAVALGVVGTAFIQAAMAALALVVADVPYAMILTAVIFLCGVIQIGAGPVLVLTSIWIYFSGSVMTAVLFFIWSLLIMTVDNFARPILIRRGVDLPLLLIFAGVIGGLISFGVIGLFIGPVMLAVSYTLVNAWIDDSEAQLSTRL